MPRTGTTSICLTMLDLGYRVAHTAYTKASINSAQVIANVPIFSHYREIDIQFPHSRFILLERNLNQWIPSIQRLLNRLLVNIISESGGHFPLLKESYDRIFYPLSRETINDRAHIRRCYERHQIDIFNYLKDKNNNFITIDVGKVEDYNKLLIFLNNSSTSRNFQHVNKNNKITYWKSISHPNKVNSLLKENSKLDMITTFPFTD